ncbi:AMIN domain-containing protein [Granulicella sp. WH15]|nr:AMIN domain-containing protein [Granulicella sp. WH15]
MLAAGRTARHTPPPTPWEQATEAREHLEAIPEDARSKADYTRALDKFRTIYHDNPRDAHAAEAVNTVAELLAEQGHSLDDVKSLEAAVGQYEFLRTQYPGSPLRIPALLAEGKIDSEDLHDSVAAKERFALVLKLYPHSTAAAEARTGLAQLGRPKGAEATAGGIKSAPQGLKPAAPASSYSTAEAVPAATRHPANDAVATTTKPDAKIAARTADSADAPVALPVTTTAKTTRTTPLAQVTGIRHWSTSTYTRVAIDLGDEVTFEAARVPNPDRIYFDLHGAKLAQELVGKSFTVNDDGFLKRIRAAQSSGDVTRVVLDVNSVTEYSAFLLPNPYRLIIDIHGSKAVPGDVATTSTTTPAPKPEAQSKIDPNEVAELPVSPSASRRASAAANSSGLPPMAVTDGGDAVRPLTPQPQPERTRPEQADVMPGPAAKTSVPAPRVSAASKVTLGRPVPNTVAQSAPTMTTDVAAVSDLPGRVDATSAPTTRPIAAVVLGNKDVPDTAPLPRRSRSVAHTDAAPTKQADKTADGETSLIRALGLRIGRIVIDAGHGGHDSGTLGVDGIEEKDVVLDVALRLGKMLHERLGAEIIYTRSDDTFIPLETRTAIANKAQADLFLSIHANSSSDETARGVETYYLNFTSDPSALDVAARENAVSGQSIHQLSDLVKKITLKDKIAESREFATDVEGSLFAGLERGNAGLKNRGVKKAPFVVLIGANMPSILAEISFVTNPQDAHQLRMPEYRQRVAESLFNGVAKYENSLGGGKPVVVNRASVQ